MHALLLAYKRRTGVSCLINTSFNMHEEPIVRAPGEAIAAFLTSGLDFLALGPFLVRRPGGVPADGRDRHRGSPGA
jgi:carbamoyltransferase